MGVRVWEASKLFYHIDGLRLACYKPEHMSIITLMTDFGIKDGNVGVMKGVIWSIAPDAQVADLSHTISPQNVHEAALILYYAVDRDL